jgi:hypothetical protein
MKKFIIQIVIFFALLFVIDRVVGFSFSYMYKHSKGEHIGRQFYIADKTHEDILIFGSSRAVHHYNPQILSDSLGLSCYNCGLDGYGIILYYGWWQMIKERYHPKVILYDVTKNFDLVVGEDNHKYLGCLKEFYDRPNIHGIFDDVDKNEKYKMMSQMYRYNSRFHRITADYLGSSNCKKSNGFKPMKGELDTMRVKKKDDNEMVSKKKPIFDPFKIEYLNKLINETEGVKLIFVVSPIWYGLDEEVLTPIRDICEKRKIPFLDYSKSPKYVHIDKYFKDGAHLNARGADEFSRDLAHQVKDLISM